MTNHASQAATIRPVAAEPKRARPARARGTRPSITRPLTVTTAPGTNHKTAWESSQYH